MHVVAEGLRTCRMFNHRADRVEVEVRSLAALGGLLDGDLEVDEAIRRMVDSYQG